MYRIIFEHHPKEGQEKAFIEQWQKGSDIIQTYPGAKGTKLFRSLDNPTTLYAIADWESKAMRDEAMSVIDKRVDGQSVRHEHEKYLESHKIIASGELIAESNLSSPLNN